MRCDSQTKLFIVRRPIISLGGFFPCAQAIFDIRNRRRRRCENDLCVGRVRREGSARGTGVERVCFEMTLTALVVL